MFEIYSILFLLLSLLKTIQGAPTSTIVSTTGTVDILTGFTGFASCDTNQTKILKQAALDAQKIADAGLDAIREELYVEVYPQKNHQQVDFSKQAAIDFFGPESQNSAEQSRIFDTMYNAAQAYPGWGLSDWWNNRYIYLSCKDEDGDCAAGNVVAYYSSDHKYDYPLVVFCDPFFNSPKVPSLGDAINQINANNDLKQNSMNLRTQATTFLHELLHINWGTAQECRGVVEGRACDDSWQVLGGKLGKTYRAGAARLLAKRNTTIASTTNDNYAFYAATKFMEKTWGVDPKYPAAWDPALTREENQKAQENEPGFPDRLKTNSIDDGDLWEDTADPDANAPSSGVSDDSIYPSNSWPEWYQPVLDGTAGNVSNVTEPSGNSLTYNGPSADTVVCNTSGGSPAIDDCFHAFGSLKANPSDMVLQLANGTSGTTWWAGYVWSCAIAIQFTDDWDKNTCNMTLGDVNDYATIITEKCETGNFSTNLGGYAPISITGCPGQVEIISTGSAAMPLQPQPL